MRTVHPPAATLTEEMTAVIGEVPAPMTPGYRARLTSWATARALDTASTGLGLFNSGYPEDAHEMFDLAVAYLALLQQHQDIDADHFPAAVREQQ